MLEGDVRRWDRMWVVFDAAVALEPSARQTFVTKQCGDDSDLREEVMELLGSHQRADDFLECSPQRRFAADSRNGERLAGRRIGRYELRRVIAAGGMGVVYEAEQDEPKRTVALKVMRSGLASRRATRRFEYESQILGRLQHPGIAQVHEAGMCDDGAGGVPFFAMELIDGVPLTTYAKDHDLDVRHRLALIAQVCDAVHHAHSRGVVHRDLKPSNILVDDRGQTKILDFGVALVTDADILATTMHPELSEVVGTVPYMSPEQLAGDVDAIDAPSDVYSLGVVGYELLSGRLPYEFESSSIFDAAQIIREKAPTPLGNLDRSLRGDVETIVNKALEKEPARRYESAAELAADIRRYLDDRPIAARPPTKAYQFRKFTKRNKVLVGGVCATMLALATGSIISIWQAVRATNAEQRAVDRFDDVRELAHGVIFDLHDAIEHLPGATPARLLLVDEALTYLERLRVDAPDDPALQLELADAYERIGDIQGGIFAHSNLGDPAGARRSYQTAIDLLEHLLAEDPRSIALRHALARTTLKLGVDTPTDMYDDPENPYYVRAQAMLEELATESDDPDIQINLAMALMYRGVHVRQVIGPEAGLKLLSQTVDICESLAAQHPDNRNVHRTLAEAYRRFADVMRTQGNLIDGMQAVWRDNPYVDRPGALTPIQCLEQALEHYSQSLRADPLNASLQFDLANTHGSLARELAWTGRAEEAISHASEAARITEAISAADPTNARAFRTVEIHYYRFGETLELLGDHASFSPEARLEYWQESRLWYDRALTQHMERQQRGWASDYEKRLYPAQLQERFDRCEAAISALEALLDSGNGSGAE